MILIGQYDSPFVRRVGIALRLYDLPFEHRPWSVYGDAERLSALNPLGGVPTLVLDDGEVLIDSKIILDHLDSLVAPDRRLWPQKPAALLKARQVTALATGLADRAVSLFYERRLHDVVSPVLAPRRAGQITATLAALERDRAARPGPWWCAGPFSHADIAVTCVLRQIEASLPDLLDTARYPALAAHAAAMEAMPVFAEISQPFVPPS